MGRVAARWPAPFNPGQQKGEHKPMSIQTKTRATHRVYTIVSPSVIPWQGTDYNFGQHTLIHEDHPIRVAHPELFQLARLNYDVEDASAAPGETR